MKDYYQYHAHSLETARSILNASVLIKFIKIWEKRFSRNLELTCPDPINACLSFAYTMLTHECTASLKTARLEPTMEPFMFPVLVALPFHLI